MTLGIPSFQRGLNRQVRSTRALGGRPAELERGAGPDRWEGRSVWESDGPLALGAK
jgi:hypothetical protein